MTKITNEYSLNGSIARLRQELVPRVKQFFSFPTFDARHKSSLQVDHPAPAPPKIDVPQIFRAVVIGVSTGGPNALGVFLPGLPASFPLPVFVVQHMPPLFTRTLAERLNNTCHLPVSEARNGEEVHPGRIYIAPGDFHMKISSNTAGMHIALDQTPPLNSCRPAVDALFAAVSDTLGGAAIAIILTGMGQDGLQGVRLLKAKGAFVIAQDEASSVVWGMPGAIVNAGLADRILSLDRIADEVLIRTAL